jgi:hypothetical protein
MWQNEYKKGLNPNSWRVKTFKMLLGMGQIN